MPSSGLSHPESPYYLTNLPPKLLRLIFESTLPRGLTFSFTGKRLMATRKVETIEGREYEVARQVCRLCEGERLCRYGVHVQTLLFLVCRGFAGEARGGL